MKKILIISLIFVFTPIIKPSHHNKPIACNSFAIEKNTCNSDQQNRISFAYGNIGVYSLGLLLPNCGIGYRTQKKRIGFDISFTVTPGFIFNILRTTPEILFYFHPNPESEWYMGLGCGIGACIPSKTSFMCDTCLVIYPALIIGKQYQNTKGKNRFIEVQVGPSRFLHHAMDKPFFHHVPLFSVNFGIGF
jgi:hypothetical protein